ncbi:MAG: DUF1232 domain-containing protein [Candidatus Berkelbacteria bacterium]|nr:DUF1232 domain-containing protein [Candidatus Berkelbacteria bacterium]
MDAFWDFLKVIVICITALLVVFFVLLALPNSKLRQSILKIYSIISLVATIFSAVYIISPVDIIPDVIPVAGQGDDMVAAISGLATAISGYVAWQKSKEKQISD